MCTCERYNARRGVGVSLVSRLFRFRAYNTARSLERGANCIIGAGNYGQSDEATTSRGSKATKTTKATLGDVNIQ